MAIVTPKSVGSPPFAIVHLSATLPDGAATDVFTDEFRGYPNAPLDVYANIDATDLTAEADVVLQGSPDEGTTWFDLKDDLITTIDNAAKHAQHLPASEGQAPLYRFKLDSAANQGAEVVRILVVFFRDPSSI